MTPVDFLKGMVSRREANNSKEWAHVEDRLEFRCWIPFDGIVFAWIKIVLDWLVLIAITKQSGTGKELPRTRTIRRQRDVVCFHSTYELYQYAVLNSDF